MFARLLQGEESRDAFLHVAERFFCRRDRHLNMLTNSVARLMHLKKEATQSLVRDLPGARPPLPYPVRGMRAWCKRDDGQIDPGGEKKGEEEENHLVMDTSTLTTYIQNRQKTDIDNLCSALERTLNGSIDTGTFQNMCFVYSGKAQSYREITGTMVAQKMRSPKSRTNEGPVPTCHSDESSDSRTKDLEIASTSSIITNDSWV